MTTDDLTAPGWRWIGGAGTPSGTMGSSGVAVPFDRIRAVLTRLPYVYEHELPFIDEADRGYLSQELSAFMLAWLAGLSCPVLNRPSPSSLLGVGWRPERWLLEAARVGLPTRPLRRTPDQPIHGTPNGPVVRAAVVGDRVLHSPCPEFSPRLRALARAAAVDLLAVECVLLRQQWWVRGADLFVDLDDPAIADAILEHLR
ncbi:MAG: hypothetical protein AB1Z98_32995 [Nannocystaceae bacterium]